MGWLSRSLAAATLVANGATLGALHLVQGRIGEGPRATAVAGTPSAFAVATSRTTDGLFHLDARSGRVTVDLVVDTGASVTVLTSADARRLHAVRLDRRDRAPLLQTASGQAAIAWWRVPRLTVAGQRLGSVEVAVVDGGLNRSLLGQDLLARLGEIAIADDRMTIRPPSRS